jgi:hypothetical protein
VGTDDEKPLQIESNVHISYQPGHAAVLAEREACAKLADLQAALNRQRGTEIGEDCATTAEYIARSIRFRTELEQMLP